MGKRILRNGILIVILLLFFTSASTLARYFLQACNSQSDMASLAQQKVTQDGKMTAKGYVMGEYLDLWRKNKDLIGWIRIKGTRIDYPVMQTKDNPEYYLRRNFKKKQDISGVPFMDADSDIFLPTQNWMIYGHNMRSGIMFHDLLKYADKDFYKQHKEISFDTIYRGQQATYKVLAVFYARVDTTGFRCFDYAGMTSEEEYQEYVSKVKRLSLYPTDIDAEFGEQLITLTTCSYHVPNKKGRFVVVAKEIH